MPINKIYKYQFDAVVNPLYGFGYDLPYYTLGGTLVVELLDPMMVPIGGASTTNITTECLIDQTNRVRVVPNSASGTLITWNNVNAIIRYIRISDTVVPTLQDPYMVVLDMEENIVLDNDNFTLFFNTGILTLEGQLA